MSLNRSFAYLTIGFIFINKIIAATNMYCPPVTALKCSDPHGCSLSSQYKNWQVVNQFITEGQSLTSFNSAYIFDNNDADGIYGMVQCFYSGPEHSYAEVQIRTHAGKFFYYPAKASAWNPTYAPDFKYFYNCVATNLNSCGFTEGAAK